MKIRWHDLKTFIHYFKKLCYVAACFAYIYVSVLCVRLVPMKAGEGVQSPETGVTGSL